MTDVFEKFGGRKFVLAVLAVVFGFILALTSKVDAKDFMDFVKWALGIFTVGNIGSYVVTNIKEKKD